MSSKSTPSKEEVKHHHSEYRACENCHFKAGRDLRACARCKTAMYCSKECQKEHWRTHKASCNAFAESGIAAATKLGDRFFAEPFLSRYLELAMIHKFKTLKQKLSLDKPYLARVFIGIEPTESSEFEKLWNSAASYNQRERHRPRGMLQVLSLEVVDQPTSTMVENMPKFTNAKFLINTLGPGNVLAIALVEFVRCSALEGYANCGTIPFTEEVFEMASTLDSLVVPAISGNGRGVSKPLTADACLEFINMSIRMDNENRYRLRKEMDLSEIHMILQAAEMSDTISELEYAEETRKAWRTKVKREDIYSTIRDATPSLED